jgi:signal transduction histidine kinase
LPKDFWLKRIWDLSHGQSVTRVKTTEKRLIKKIICDKRKLFEVWCSLGLYGAIPAVHPARKTIKKKAMNFTASPTDVFPDPRTVPGDRRGKPRRAEDQGLKALVQEQSRRLQSLLELGRLINLDLNLNTLLTQIAQKTAEIIKADRSSVFLYDPEKDELWSTVALGLADGNIRMPAGTGLAGDCFRSGQPINLPDVYQDQRFNPEVDKQTGYRTQSLCCLPIKNREKKIIGVIQLLNKEGGFTVEDMSFLQTFCNQAAVFLEMAQLQKARIEALEQAQEELRSLNRAKDKALDHLSHELRTPLSVIHGEVRLLKRRLSTPPLQPIKPEIFSRMEKNLDRLAEIQKETDQIIRSYQELEDSRFLEGAEQWLIRRLAGREIPEEIQTYWQIVRSWITGPESSQPLPAPKPLRLHPFLRKLMDALVLKCPHRDLKIDLQGQADLSLPVEPRSLAEAFTSLFKNAVENTPDQGRISVFIQKQDKEVIIGVKDTGVGIRGEDQKYLFDGLFHTQETEDYTSKKPYEFNAGGKGLDLHRTYLSGKRFGFQIGVHSERCRFLAEKTDPCPGKISLCRYCQEPKDCAESGGSLFTLTFTLPTAEGQGFSPPPTPLKRK